MTNLEHGIHSIIQFGNPKLLTFEHDYKREREGKKESREPRAIEMEGLRKKRHKGREREGKETHRERKETHR